VQANKAIVGENAFAHESGIHTRGVTEKPLTFEPIKPELVGRTRKLVAGKLAGTRGICAELEEIGIHPTEKQLKEIVQRVKELGDKGKMVTDADLLALTSAVMGEVIGDLNSRRGQIQGIETHGETCVIHCFMPLAESFGYATTLRSLTQGRATSSMEFQRNPLHPKISDWPCFENSFCVIEWQMERQSGP